MNAEELRAWRHRLALTQELAAARLDITRRMYQHYEAGTAEIPKAIGLACAAIAIGLEDYPAQPMPVTKTKRG